MFEYRSAPDDDAAPLDNASADAGARDATKRPESMPVPRVDPVQFLPGSYSMDGMTAILPGGLFGTLESCPQRADNPSAADQHRVSKADKPGRKKP